MRIKNVLITGSATGLGIALSECFLQNGYRVWGTFHITPHQREFLQRYNGLFVPVQMDVRDAQSIAQASEQLKHHLEASDEQLTLIVNNAANFSPGPLLEAQPEDMLREYHTNVIGPILVIRYFKPLFARDKNARQTHIINISSYLSKAPLPFVGSYCATKSALNAVTDTLRMELILHRLKIVNVLLGIVKTGVLDKQLEKIEAFKNSEYLPFIKARVEKSKALWQRTGCPPAFAAQQIFQIAQTNDPRNNYLVASNPVFLRVAAALAPTKIYLWIIKKYYFNVSARQSINLSTHQPVD